MYIESVPNRTSPPAVLLRESYRENGKVKKRTLANLSKLPPEMVEGLKVVLRGGTAVEGGLGGAFEIGRSLPHGHVAAVLGTMKQLGLPKLLSKKDFAHRKAVLAMIAARILFPASKLATTRHLSAETMTTSLSGQLGLEDVSEDALYEAMDWLLTKQDRIESEFASRHLEGGSLVLYDLTSVYFEGRHCEIARHGYSRDKKKGKLQVEFGLLCDREGRPIAVEVFEGNVGDPSTVATQVRKLRERFGLEHVVVVGDRGMLTSARIDEDLWPEELDWISALRGSQIRTLVESEALQLSLFDERDLAVVTHPDFSGERLIACRNPMLETESRRKREDLLEATERKLDRIRKMVVRDRNPLRDAIEIALRVGRVLETSPVRRLFALDIQEGHFEFRRNDRELARAAVRDGLYVIRTSLRAERMSAEDAVAAYKSLSRVERAFRAMKTVDLKVRPVYHRKPERVRAHILLCMLAYYVEWHMRDRLAPLLFEDHDAEAAKAERESPVARATRSDAALRKAARGQTDDGLPVHSFQTLLADLGTLTLNTIVPTVGSAPAFQKLARPTPLQQRALDLLGVTLSV